MNRKYCLDTAENKAFLQSLTDELIAFGRRFPSPEGASFYLGDDGTPWEERNRETWITCRMAHVYSIGQMLGCDGCGELADAALRGLNGVLRDRVHGGWYAGVTKDGGIVPNKQCYAHAFVILAASSAMLAGRPGAEELLREALDFYDRYFWNESEGMACDTWNTEMTVLEDYRGINANMHTVEAFLAVADATGETRYRERAGRIIDRVIGWAKANSFRIPEHYTKEWQPDLECNREKPDDPFKPYGATPGHGIEWARLIAQWALSVWPDGSRASEPYIEAAQSLYCRAVEDAWFADGAPGIVYTTDWEGRPVVHDRMHWTLAEAVNTSAVLYRITGKRRYADDYATFMEYLDSTVLDHENGSWFHQLDRNNKLMGTVWPGKSDIYHAFQATLIPYRSTAVSVASAVYREKPEVTALGELLIDFTENGVSPSGNPVLEANPGGAPCNVLAMLQKLGRRTAFVGMVGQDSFGDFLTETVRALGINTDNLKRTDKAGTTLAFVHTAEDGDRSFSFYRNPGADMLLREEDIDFRLLKRSKVFHYGTLSMTDPEQERVTKAAVAFAEENGLLRSFDPNLRPLLWPDMARAKEMMEYGIRHCDILKIADDEIGFLTGKEDVWEGMEEIYAQYAPKLMCATLGRGGSIACYGDLRVFVPAYVREDTIETTGAGDTFMACVLDTVLQYGTDALNETVLRRMLSFANAAAALVTTRRGALKVMPTREEVLALMDE